MLPNPLWLYIAISAYVIIRLVKQHRELYITDTTCDPMYDSFVYCVYSL